MYYFAFQTLPLMKYPQDMGLADEFQTIDLRGNQVINSSYDDVISYFSKCTNVANVPTKPSMFDSSY